MHAASHRRLTGFPAAPIASEHCVILRGASPCTRLHRPEIQDTRCRRTAPVSVRAHSPPTAAFALGTAAALAGATAASAVVDSYRRLDRGGRQLVGKPDLGAGAGERRPRPQHDHLLDHRGDHSRPGLSRCRTIDYDTTIDGPGSADLTIENTDSTELRVLRLGVRGHRHRNIVIDGISFSGFSNTVHLGCVDATITDVDIDNGSDGGGGFVDGRALSTPGLRARRR